MCVCVCGVWKLCSYLAEEAYPAETIVGKHAQSSEEKEKGTPIGVVYRARGPALGSWEHLPPAAYEVGGATALHLRPPLSYPRSYITLINAVPAQPSQHGYL
eukprot:9501722-Pyramimonas_sp.AAC.1